MPGTAPKSSSGVIAAGFALSSASAASHPAPQGPERPCGGCCNSSHAIWGALNWEAHSEGTAWDLEETQGQWCVEGSWARWYKQGESHCEDEGAAAAWGGSKRCTVAPVLREGSSAIPWVEPQPTHLPWSLCLVRVG